MSLLRFLASLNSSYLVGPVIQVLCQFPFTWLEQILYIKDLPEMWRLKVNPFGF